MQKSYIYQKFLIMLNYFRRINGLSTPIFGVSWEFKVSDKTVLKNYFVDISNLRSLHPGHEVLKISNLIDSIKLFRKINTDVLKSQNSESYINNQIQYINDISIEFSNYLDIVESKKSNIYSDEFISVYNDFRERLRKTLELLAEKYELKMPKKFIEG